MGIINKISNEAEQIPLKMVSVFRLGVKSLHSQLKCQVWPDTALSLQLLYASLTLLMKHKIIGRANQDLEYSCFDEKLCKPNSVSMVQN